VTGSAVVQDWFFAPGGSEEVAIEIAGLLPGSEVITNFMEPGYRERLAGHEIRTWPLQRIIGATKRYRSFLPLYLPGSIGGFAHLGCANLMSDCGAAISLGRLPLPTGYPHRSR